MKDLRSALSQALGVPAPAPEADEAPRLAGPLVEGAHLGSDWLVRLRAVHATVSGAPTLAPEPKLNAARQVSDILVKRLKKAGRRREARELADLRDSWFARRDRAAWTAIKARFHELGLSDKAYRGLKQGGAEPLTVLARLERSEEGELVGLGARRLRELLSGR